MNVELLRKIETAQSYLGHQRGQKRNIMTLLNNWAECCQMLEQILGEEYERTSDGC